MVDDPTLAWVGRPSALPPPALGDLPLKMLEESKLLREPAREVRRVQDHTIGAIYDLIREINQQVGSLASDLLAESTKRRAADKEDAHHRATAR